MPGFMTSLAQKLGLAKDYSQGVEEPVIAGWDPDRIKAIYDDVQRRRQMLPPDAAADAPVSPLSAEVDHTAGLVGQATPTDAQSTADWALEMEAKRRRGSGKLVPAAADQSEALKE